MSRIVADRTSAWLVGIGGWTAAIACRICSLYRDKMDGFSVLVVGVSCLLAIVAAVFLLRDRRFPLEPLYFIFILGTFSSVADLLISLEADGRIKGWADFYLDFGEPYLATPHGIAGCYWDFFGHYFHYIGMLYLICKGISIRNLAMFWFGSIAHSLVIFLPGNILGIHGAQWSYLLNVPYVFVPLYVFYRVTRVDRSRISLGEETHKATCRSIFLRPLDVLLIVGLLISLIIAFVRGFAALDCSVPFFRDYRDSVEPYMKDPVFYPKLQMLTYLFYFSFVYSCCIYGLLRPGCTWVLDMALVHAGAAVQAQVCHIAASLHWKTEEKFHPPGPARLQFWLVNLLLLVAPLLLMLRVLLQPHFFLLYLPKEGKKPKNS